MRFGRVGTPWFGLPGSVGLVWLLGLFEVVTVISRPVDQVFAFLVDASTTPDWTPGLTEARQTSDGPVGAGTTVLFIGKFLLVWGTRGRRFESCLPDHCGEVITA
jgi:hypothetical protein